MLSLVQSIEGNPFEQTIKSITKNGKSS